MIAGSHRVRRLRWRVRVGTRDEAFAVRPALRHSVTGQIVPALDRLFDDIPVGAAVVHIPRLEVHVRAAGMESVAGDCLDAIRAQLAARLRDVAARPATERRADTLVDTALDRRETRAAALRQYLHSGVLPWYFAGGGHGAATSAALEEIAREELDTLAAEIPGDPRAGMVFVFRLLALLPDSTWPDVVRGVLSRSHGEAGEPLMAAMRELSSANAPAVIEHVRLQLAAALIVMTAAPGWTAAAAHVRQKINLPPGLTLDRLKTYVPRVISLLGPAPRRLMPEPAGPAPTVDPVAGVTPAAPPAKARWRGLWPEPAREPAFDTSPAAAASFGLTVSHAGLVLIAPFIPRLFEARNIAVPQAKSLASPVLPLACALLHFAATGREDGHEFEMAFIKILLGVHHDTPVPFARGLLKKGDRDEVDSLLTAVVGHWRVLKRTSADGLRTAFLQRRGLLVEEHTQWRLQVEGASIDLLLNQLPWGISTVTLPWLNKPIQTEWTAP